MRHEKVRLNWLDEDFVEHEQVFEGFLARIIQHEYDHLDGILYPMRVRDMRRFGFTDITSPTWPLESWTTLPGG